ncbi:hypothetical protein L7750_08760 [Xenorhabdus bovienii]|uniref:hypothetical protein n=1 Tax=Xenorhabdus bovienii TaxID=40576 RepID=UPI001EDF0394|nr:hypothetical protein [Xenorhabdus bovienii]MCG3470475.1 hypothetical protein [Xenorhabdus bovienii]
MPDKPGQPGVTVDVIVIGADHFQVCHGFKAGQVGFKGLLHRVPAELALADVFEQFIHHPGLPDTLGRVNIVFRIINQPRHPALGAVTVIHCPVGKELTG